MDRTEFINTKIQINKVRESIGNNQCQLQFFLTQENQIMVDKLDLIIKNQRILVKDLELKISKSKFKSDDD